MSLTKKDFASETWARLVAHLNTELEAQRVQLESKLIDADITAALRGDISRIRKLLALDPLASERTGPANAPGTREGADQDDEGF